MKRIIALLLLMFSMNTYSMDGNQLHKLINSQDSNEIINATMYITGVNDALGMLKDLEILDSKSIHKKPNLSYFNCYPEGAIVQQALDIVKNYLNSHPEKRSQPAISLVMLALAEKWPCETE